MIHHCGASASHSCAACGVTACSICSMEYSSANVLICSPCAGTIRKQRKIPDEYIKAKARSQMDDQDHESHNEGLSQASQPGFSQMASQGGPTQESQDILPYGQGSQKNPKQDSSSSELDN